MKISDLMEILEMAKKEYGNLSVKAYDDNYDEDPLVAYVSSFKMYQAWNKKTKVYKEYLQINAGGNFGIRDGDIIIKHPKNK